MVEGDHSHNYNPALFEKLLFRVSKRWIAGYTAEDAIRAARFCIGSGMSPILNYLGEETSDKNEIDRTVTEYVYLLSLLHANKIRGAISVKPSQIGLTVNFNTCLENLLTISEYAKKHNTFLWIDMESYQFVENTLSAYLDIFDRNKTVGVVVQSYLKRSYSDLMHIIELGGHIRLVKGAYSENQTRAFHSSQEIDENFAILMRYLFTHARGTEILAIATHDSKLIEEAIDLCKSEELMSIVQFQFLKGIRDELKKELVQKKFSIWEYIPYGETWLPYSIRRMRERKRNIIMLARSLIQP